jgi:hypothetical protein
MVKESKETPAVLAQRLRLCTHLIFVFKKKILPNDFFLILLYLFLDRNESDEKPALPAQRLRCQYLYFCTSEASELITCPRSSAGVSICPCS